MKVVLDADKAFLEAFEEHLGHRPMASDMLDLVITALERHRDRFLDENDPRDVVIAGLETYRFELAIE